MQALRSSSSIALLFALVSTATVSAQRPAPAPTRAGANIRERLGTALDLGLAFRDHRNRSVRLGDYFDRRRPVLLTLNYYRCRTLCDLQLGQLATRLRELDVASTPFRALSVSIDPRDTAEQARAKRQLHVGSAKLDWSFLVGSTASVRALAAELGTEFRYDARTDQYAHAPALFVATPDGRVARYLYGVDYASRDVNFALIEAAQGRSGRSADRFLLSCFRYDAASGRYTPYVLGFVRLGGVLTVLALALLVLVLHRREPHGA